jgi:hypothetical protein
MHKRGSRGIIVGVQQGAVKIYVAAAVEAAKKKERQGETLGTIKSDGFLTLTPFHLFLTLRITLLLQLQQLVF